MLQHANHHLARVQTALQRAERELRLQCQVEAAQRQARHRCCCCTRRKQHQHAVHPPRIVCHVHVECNRAVHCRLGSRILACRRPHTALPDLLKDTAIAKARKRHRNEVYGEAVEHTVPAMGRCNLHAARAECRSISRATHPLCTGGEHLPVLVRTTSTAQDARVQPLGILDRLQPNAPHSSMDHCEHAALHAPTFYSRIGGAPCDGQRRCLLKRQRQRLPRKQATIAESQRREWRRCNPKHGAPDRMVHRSTCITHDARRVAARRSRVARILPKHVQHVTEVEPNRSHSQLNLAIDQCRRHQQSLNEQACHCTPSMEVQAQQPAASSWGCGDESRHQVRCCEQHCLWLRERPTTRDRW